MVAVSRWAWSIKVHKTENEIEGVKKRGYKILMDRHERMKNERAKAK
jgi:hypothetical protein